MRGQKMIGFECTIAVDEHRPDDPRNRGQRRSPRRAEVPHPDRGHCRLLLRHRRQRGRHQSARTERVTGTVLQVSVSRGGIPKRAIPSAELTERGNCRRRVALPVPRRPAQGDPAGHDRRHRRTLLARLSALSRGAGRELSRRAASIAAHCDSASACWSVTRRSN